MSQLMWVRCSVKLGSHGYRAHLCLLSVFSVDTGSIGGHSVRRGGGMGGSLGKKKRKTLTGEPNLLTFLDHTVINKVHTQRLRSRASQRVPWVKMLTVQT